MLQKFLLASALSVAALVGASQLSVAVAAEETQATDQAALDLKIAAIEALVLQYKDNPAGLEQAVELYVSGSDDPEAAGNAVLIVFDHSNNPEVAALLAANGELQTALGNGLGSAIAIIALNNPDLATKMTANVVATGNSSLVASVQSGTDTKTASLAEAAKTETDTGTGDTTPENAASGT